MVLSLSKLFFSLFSLALVFCVRGEFQCPPQNETAPCICGSGSNKDYGLLICVELSSQVQLSAFMDKVKALNSNETRLKLQSFNLNLATASLTSLDLTPLTQCDMDILSFGSNPYLTTIPPHVDSGSGQNKIHVQSITIAGTPLSNLDVGNLLTYVNSSTSPIRLLIEDSPRFTGNRKGSPIIPGLSSFPNLTTITFRNTSIEEINTSAFEGSRGLTFIDLSNHKITKLGKDAFTIDQSVQNGTLLINLDNNLLQSDSSSIQPGFIPERRPFFDFTYSMSMQNNNLTTLPEATFKNMLYPWGLLVVLSLKGNQFFCDDGMHWIKSGPDREMWETVVSNVDCTNDPGKDIFTTDLVQAKSGANSLVQLNGMNFIILFCTIFPFALFKSD